MEVEVHVEQRPRRTVRNVALGFALANLLIGLAGFAGPAVKGNRDRYVNIHPGLLFGIFAINWLHALVHVAAAVPGLNWWRTRRRARGYMALLAGLFGFLATMGWMRGRWRPGIYMVMGMALNRASNMLHTFWAAGAALFALDPDLTFTRRLLGAREPTAETVVLEEEETLVAPEDLVFEEAWGI